MNDIICNFCFSRPSKFIRQCKCCYCNECREQSPDVCICGERGA